MDKITNMLQAFNAFRKNIRSKIVRQEDFKEETIKIWQANFFADILVFLGPLSVVLFIPSFIMCIHDGLNILAIFDSIAFVVVQYIFFSKTLSLKTRKTILLVDLYLIGVALLYFLGWSGPGLVYLLGFSAFSTLILSSRTGYIALSMNALMFVIFATLSHFQLVEDKMLSGFIPAAIITVGLNFIILNLVLVISISSLIKGLQTKIKTEQEVQQKLEIEMEGHKQAMIRAEESDRLKTIFMANMSHEIRTPMNGILGFAQLLREPHVEEEKRELFLKIIDESGHRMLNLINDIIDISQIESGQVQVVIKEVNVNDLFDSLLSAFTPEARREEIHLSLRKTLPHSHAIIRTDGEKIYAILVNLIKNAIKYSKSDVIELGYEKFDNLIKFFVKDSGIGIPMEKQLAIFDRFVKVDYSSTKEGTGLGLAICKGHVELLEGEIWLESQIKKGTTFYFTIPLK